jgi:hypothetical protein
MRKDAIGQIAAWRPDDIERRAATADERRRDERRENERRVRQNVTCNVSVSSSDG